MEFPARVEREMFARRLGGGKLCDPQHGARASNKGANDRNDFHFQFQICDECGDASNVCAANQWVMIRASIVQTRTHGMS
jgi:hypothetical protein